MKEVDASLLLLLKSSTLHFLIEQSAEKVESLYTVCPLATHLSSAVRLLRHPQNERFEATFENGDSGGSVQFKSLARPG